MNRAIRDLVCSVLIAVGGFASALAQADEAKPDLSGNDPHWIEDIVSQCWAANPNPAGNEIISWSGACEGGLLSGPGTLTWSQNGRISGRDEGTFREGRLTGKGRITTVDGASYEGEFPGPGTLTLPDGRRIPARTVRESTGWTIEAPILAQPPL